MLSEQLMDTWLPNGALTRLTLHPLSLQRPANVSRQPRVAATGYQFTHRLAGEF